VLSDGFGIERLKLWGNLLASNLCERLMGLLGSPPLLPVLHHLLSRHLLHDSPGNRDPLNLQLKYHPKKIGGAAAQPAAAEDARIQNDQGMFQFVDT
jgi:hypothetical protein